MAGVHGLRLLLALLLPVVSASTVGTVVRINKAVLSYVSEFGKVPLQEALKVDDQHFLDQSSEVLQTVRIQVPEVRVTRLHLKFLPDFGISVWAAANFTVKVFCLSPALLATLQKDIKAVLSSKVKTLRAARDGVLLSEGGLNLNLANLVDNINIHMGTLIELQLQCAGICCDTVCQLTAAPRESTGVGLHHPGRQAVTLGTRVTRAGLACPGGRGSGLAVADAVLFLLGNPIILPMDTPHLELPELVGNKAAMATLALSQNLFDSVLLLLQKAGALNLDITAHLVAHQVPEHKPVVLKVRLGATPVAAFHNRSITLQLQPLVEVLATSSNSAFQSLFSLTVGVNLNLQLSVSKAKLYGTTSVVGDIYLAVASSNVGSINLDGVYTLMDTVFEKPLLEHFNALLGIGISLPTVTNLHYVNSDICINEALAPGGAMLRILCLALCGLLPGTRADPGALLRLGMDILNHEVQSAMEESHILEKMAAEAGKKRPGVKPIKGITNMKVKDVQLPVITLNFVPEVGIFQCVSTGMTITGKRAAEIMGKEGTGTVALDRRCPQCRPAPSSSFMGGNMEIIIVLNITATNRLLQEEETGLPVFKSEGCEITLVSVKTNLPSNMLPKMVNKFLDSTLHKVLPGMVSSRSGLSLPCWVAQAWREECRGQLEMATLSTGGGSNGACSCSDDQALGRDTSLTFQALNTELEGEAPCRDPLTQGPLCFQLCPAIDAVLVYVNQKWARLSDPMPVGQMGTVKYALMSTPATTASHIQVDFSPEVTQQKGKTIKLAEDGGPLEIPGGYAEGSSQLLLSAALLTAELALLQKSFNMDIQDQTVAEAYPKPKPVVTQIRINKPPKVTMKTGKSLLHFHGSLEIFTTRRRGKPPMSLFLLETHFNLKIQYSVQGNRLQMDTSVDRLLSLTRGSSSIGNFNEEELTGYITDYLQEAFVPVVNDVLRVGFPLPDLLAIDYNLAELHIAENALVLDLKRD
ncbi:Hypothetical predicted protein [Marmota monax]|uniref:Lipid-binding serum glycoprotein C-terminal domain-containing protein n=2 Tax=Marmota monax TaxID=9995 RepID=A0A5E4A6A9_MARMO|nr:hypothetical protein GHT09_016444 [Marmota monax]VTJ52740.1 Hypothetical predicted protein [Marmota monax]